MKMFPFSCNSFIYTDGKGQVYGALLVQLCDLITHIVSNLRLSMRKDILEIQNIFALLDRSSIRELFANMSKNAENTKKNSNK